MGLTDTVGTQRASSTGQIKQFFVAVTVDGKGTNVILQVCCFWLSLVKGMKVNINTLWQYCRC